jgi:hypothetical protein
VTKGQLHLLDQLTFAHERLPYPGPVTCEALRAILDERAEWLAKTREAFAALGGQRPQRAADILEDMIVRADGGQL